MYPSFRNISDRHQQQKDLLHKLELEANINKIQAELYSTADWNGTSFVSLAPSATKLSLSTQPIPSMSVANDILSRFTPKTTENEPIRPKVPSNLIDELKLKLGRNNLGLNRGRRTPASPVDPMDVVSPPLSNVSMDPGSEGYQTPDERVRFRMNSDQSMVSSRPDSDDSILRALDESEGTISPTTTATTYIGTIGNIEQDDVPPTERDLSAKVSSDFVKALMDPSKASGAFYDKIIQEPIFEHKESRLSFRPISKSTGKPLTKATWNIVEKKWTNSSGEQANVDDIKTFIALWKAIKENFNGNPNALLRERNTLPKPAADYAISIADSPPVSQVGKGFKGGRVGRFNHLTYKTIGARKVHLPSLQSGYLSVRHMNGTMAGRKTKVDDQLLRLIKEFVFKDNIDQPLYDALDVDDQTIFSELLKATRIQNTLKDGWQNPKEALKARYDKLLGELNMNNDSVVPELKKVIVDMFSQGMISDKQFKQLFEHLL